MGVFSAGPSDLGAMHTSLALCTGLYASHEDMMAIIANFHYCLCHALFSCHFGFSS